MKIDVAFVDTLDRETPMRKAVSMLVYVGAGRSSGRIRSQGVNGGVINIDAVPTLHPEHVFLYLTIEYLPEPSGQNQAQRFGSVTHSLNVALPYGKPMVVAESADPGTSRRVAVEVTATLLK